MKFSTFSTGFSTAKGHHPYTHRNSGRSFLVSFGQKCGHSAFYKKESRRIFFAFYKPFPSGDLFFLQSGMNRSQVFNTGPLPFFRVEKAGKHAVFHTVLSRLNPLSRLRRQLPRRGSFFAITETYRMNAKSFRQCYKLPLRGSCLRPTGAG